MGSDKKREGACDNLIRVMHNLGIDFDEGPVQRITDPLSVHSDWNFYKQYCDELLANGFSLLCFLESSENLMK